MSRGIDFHFKDKFIVTSQMMWGTGPDLCVGQRSFPSRFCGETLPSPAPVTQRGFTPFFAGVGNLAHGGWLGVAESPWRSPR